MKKLYLICYYHYNTLIIHNMIINRCNLPIKRYYLPRIYYLSTSIKQNIDHANNNEITTANNEITSVNNDGSLFQNIMQKLYYNKKYPLYNKNFITKYYNSCYHLNIFQLSYVHDCQQYDDKFLEERIHNYLNDAWIMTRKNKLTILDEMLGEACYYNMKLKMYVNTPYIYSDMYIPISLNNIDDHLGSVALSIAITVPFSIFYGAIHDFTGTNILITMIGLGFLFSIHLDFVKYLLIILNILIIVIQ